MDFPSYRESTASSEAKRNYTLYYYYYYWGEVMASGSSLVTQQ